jgi:glycerate 2-kinase
MKIVLAIDSFKESMTSIEAADAFKKGFSRIIRKATFVKTSISDGGEGFTESFLFNRGGRIIRVPAADPLGRKKLSSFGLFDSGKKAVVEMAKASGLMLLKPAERNPLRTGTYGTGQLIDAALRKGVKELIVGIGGSATNDGGIGMAQALGARFFDNQGALIRTPATGADLIRVSRIDLGALPSRLKGVTVYVACDVNNPMTGKNGSAAIYGPQKGATPAMVKALDAGLRNLCRIVKQDLGKEIEQFPGAGAAGGLGGGLMAFLGARLKPGIEIMLAMSRFDSLLKGADLVITGEGQIDHQSVRNKAPVGVAHAARRRGIPVLGICGRIGKGAELTYGHGISAIFSIVPGPCALEEALVKGRENMEITGENIARLIRSAKL